MLSLRLCWTPAHCALRAGSISSMTPLPWLGGIHVLKAFVFAPHLSGMRQGCRSETSCNFAHSAEIYIQVGVRNHPEARGCAVNVPFVCQHGCHYSWPTELPGLWDLQQPPTFSRAAEATDRVSYKKKLYNPWDAKLQRIEAALNPITCYPV